MEIQPISNTDGYSLFIRHLPNNLYHLNIVDPNNEVHHFKGVYSSSQAAIAQGKSVIENFKQVGRSNRKTKIVSGS